MKKLLCVAFIISSFAYAGEMVKIKGGSFTRELAIINRDEMSRQKVSCDDFMISDTEVTIKEFYDYVKSENQELPDRIKRLFNENEYNDHPIYYISFYDIINFCNWKSKQENLEPCYYIIERNIRWNKKANGYRLPTEIEWECAASSAWKDKDFLSTNIESLKKYAEIKTEENLFDNMTSDFLTKHRKLKQFSPNKNKLYDLLDGVQEYCWDVFIWQSYYDDIPNPGKSNADSEERVIKSTNSIMEGLEVSPVCITYGNAPGNTNPCIGFRVARNISK